MSGLAYLEAALDGDFAAALAGGCGLRDELDAAGLSAGAVGRILEMGIPAQLLGQLTGAGDLAAARVSLSRDGRFWQPEGPDARLLMGMREQGCLVDIVALASHDPDQWALRRGEGWCLGYDAWLACETGRAHKLRLHSTPLSWLLSGGEGVAVLDWDSALPMLRGLGEHVLLQCDRGASAKLEALLRRGGLPRIKETGGWPSTERRAAA